MMMMMEEEEEENQQPKENEEGGEGNKKIVPIDCFGFFGRVLFSGWFEAFADDSDVDVGKPDDKKEKGGDKADDKVR